MDLALPKGGADVSVLVWIESSASPGTGLTGLTYASANLTCYYARPGEASAAITLVTQTVTGAHTDGGFVEVDATNMPGIYRLDLPDAVCASGVDSAIVFLAGAAGMLDCRMEAQLTTYALASLGKAELAAALHDQAIGAASAWTAGSALDRICCKNISQTFADVDTLEAISDRLTAMVAPQGGLAASEQALTGFLSDGFLYRVIRDTRRKVDEGQINAKYTNNDVIELIRKAYEQLWMELYALDRGPIRHRVNISVTPAVQDYQLPPTVGAITELAKIDSATGMPEWESVPRDQYHVSGPGFAVEGNLIRFTPKAQAAWTLQLTFIPNGQIRPHEGQCDHDDGDGTSGEWLTLASAPSAGTLDTRDNAYGGYLFRMLGAYDGLGNPVAVYNYVQERVIRAYDNVERKATLAVALDPNPFDTGSGAHHIEYEVVPVLGPVPETLLALIAAREILSNEGNKERLKTQQDEYMKQMRSVKVARKVMMARQANALEGNVRDNPDARGWPAVWYP